MAEGRGYIGLLWVKGGLPKLPPNKLIAFVFPRVGQQKIL
jgi:hypothetical protein